MSDCRAWLDVVHLPPFWISTSPPHSVIVSDEKRYTLLVMVLNLLAICVFGVEGDLPLVFSSDE